MQTSQLSFRIEVISSCSSPSSRSGRTASGAPGGAAPGPALRGRDHRGRRARRRDPAHRGAGRGGDGHYRIGTIPRTKGGRDGILPPEQLGAAVDSRHAAPHGSVTGVYTSFGPSRRPSRRRDAAAGAPVKPAKDAPRSLFTEFSTDAPHVTSAPAPPSLMRRHRGPSQPGLHDLERGPRGGEEHDLRAPRDRRGADLPSPHARGRRRHAPADDAPPARFSQKPGLYELLHGTAPLDHARRSTTLPPAASRSRAASRGRTSPTPTTTGRSRR